MTTATSELDSPAAALVPHASTDYSGEFLAELEELASEVAEAMGDSLVAVLLGGRYGRCEGCMSLSTGAESACGDVNLYLVTASTRPRGMEKLPHLARRYEHRLRISIGFSGPITPEMIDKWPAQLAWQELALGHRVLYGGSHAPVTEQWCRPAVGRSTGGNGGSGRNTDQPTVLQLCAVHRRRFAHRLPAFLH